MKTYIFVYFLGGDMNKVREHLGHHVRYWKSKELVPYQNGPFADKTGGLIIFSADNEEEAREIVGQDPLVREKTLKEYWLKEWVL